MLNYFLLLIFELEVKIKRMKFDSFFPVHAASANYFAPFSADDFIGWFTAFVTCLLFLNLPIFSSKIHELQPLLIPRLCGWAKTLLF